MISLPTSKILSSLTANLTRTFRIVNLKVPVGDKIIKNLAKVAGQDHALAKKMSSNKMIKRVVQSSTSSLKEDRVNASRLTT